MMTLKKSPLIAGQLKRWNILQDFLKCCQTWEMNIELVATEARGLQDS